MTGYYTFVILIAACTAAITMVAVAGNAMLPRRARRLFLCLFATIVVAALCEWGGVMLNGAGPDVRPVIAVLKTVEFSLAPSLAVMYAAVLGPDDSAVKVAMCVAAAHAVLECTLAPFGLVFVVDATGTYHHGPAYALYIAAYLASALFLLTAAARFSRSFQYRNRSVPWLVIAFILASIIVQMSFSTLRIVWLAMAVGALMLYTFYCSVIQQTDALTRLLNRHAFESTISMLRERAVVMLFDVDDFKQVNDTFGHVAGDACLRFVGKTIFDVFAPHGTCFRVGGDEFCAILTSRQPDVAQALAQAFGERMDAARAAHPGLPSVSVGTSTFDPATDDLATAYDAADEQMYARKQARKG